MSMPKKFAEYAIRIEPAEVFDNAIVGISKDKVLIYSHERIVQILIAQNDFTIEDAMEWADYNIYPIIDAERPQFKVTYASRYAFKSKKRLKDIVRGMRDCHPRYR
jgi:hypothetical protein